MDPKKLAELVDTESLSRLGIDTGPAIPVSEARPRPLRRVSETDAAPPVLEPMPGFVVHEIAPGEFAYVDERFFRPGAVRTD
jgi:hypothetical protein